MKAAFGVGHAHMGLWALILVGCAGRVEYAKGGAEGDGDGGATTDGSVGTDSYRF